MPPRIAPRAGDLRAPEILRRARHPPSTSARALSGARRATKGHWRAESSTASLRAGAFCVERAPGIRGVALQLGGSLAADGGDPPLGASGPAHHQPRVPEEPDPGGLRPAGHQPVCEGDAPAVGVSAGGGLILRLPPPGWGSTGARRRSHTRAAVYRWPPLVIACCLILFAALAIWGRMSWPRR
jgi:hypothetical protein